MVRYTALLMCLAAATVMAEPRHVVHPVDTGQALENPAMGWVFHHFDNSIENYGTPLGTAYAGDGFPGLSTVYLRLPWCYVEPEEGRFNWSVVDTVAQRYIQNGKKVAFLFSCSESHSARVAVPQWVLDAGAKGYWWTWDDGVIDDPDNPKACWEPDYADPLFLEKLDNFLAAAATRYDGDPDVAFIDIGSFGLWGEGHTSGSKVPYGSEAVKKHIDLHAKHFKKTLLYANDDFPGDPADEALYLQGRRASAFVLHIPKGTPDVDLDVLVGLWDPTAKGDERNVRFAPAHGEDDRRVRLGALNINAQGVATFTRAKHTGPVDPDADFAAVDGSLLSAERPYRLKVEWDVLHDLPKSATAFAHIEKDGVFFASGWGKSVGHEGVEYARSLGMSVRDNSILAHDTPDPYFSHALAEAFWPDLPVNLESCHYGMRRDQGIWGDGIGYLEAMEAYHASYVSIHWFPDEFYRECKELVDRMNLRLGYRLQLTEASWPKETAQDGALSFEASWRNAGVAPCYPGGFPAVTLKNASGDIEAVLVDEAFDVRDLPVGPPNEAESCAQAAAFLLPPHLQPGEYGLFVSVGDRMGTPELALPYGDDDGHRRYRLGTIAITPKHGDFGVRVGEGTVVDGEFQMPVTCTIRRTLPDGVVAFAHLEEGTRIAGSLHFRDVPAEAFKKPGTVELMAFAGLAPESRGCTFTVKFGLWQPGNAACLPLNGRLLPDGAPPTRRAAVGELHIAADGKSASFSSY